MNSEEKMKLACELYMKDYPLKEIAKRLNCRTTGSIYYYLKKAKIKERKVPRVRPEEIDKIVRLYFEGKSIKEISAIVKRTFPTIYKILRAKKIPLRQSIRRLYLNELRNEAYKIALEKGFWKQRSKSGLFGETTALALIITEICEAISELRKGKEKKVCEELADAIIRILDYCGYKKYDIEMAVYKKMRKNQQRPFLHGKHF